MKDFLNVSSFGLYRLFYMKSFLCVVSKSYKFPYNIDMSNKKKLVIIGAGPSGVLAAILASESYNVILLERAGKNQKPLKRVLVSGNGRANFFNEDLLSEPYGAETLDYLVNTLGFNYRREGKLYYPFYNRSECLYDCLTQAMGERKVSIEYLDVTHINNKDKQVIGFTESSEKKTFLFDNLILAMGGAAYDRKSDNHVLLDDLSLTYHKFIPCLCPIKTKEKIPSYLKNQRLKCLLTLKSDSKTIYQEDGEVLFKEDGLSGICIFNATLKINEINRSNSKATFEFELKYDSIQGQSIQNKSHSSLPRFLTKYLLERNIEYPNPLTFTFDSLYPLSESQIAFGGIDRNEIDETYQLKKHAGIHAIGELLDYNYPCGGYNMGHSLIEGYIVGKRLKYGKI